jgi:hypothetical protein
LINTSLISEYFNNQSTEGAEFVWVSECQKGEGCEIINQFVFICLGRQPKQIMVAKFQTLMLLIASAESSPLF